MSEHPVTPTKVEMGKKKIYSVTFTAHARFE